MFKLTAEMGLRLRGLRLRAGLTQQELAVLMGRQGKGNHQLIGKVERSKAPYPSLGFIADYLRACRASFSDIADLLEAYTSKPTALEQHGYKRVASLASKLSRQVAKAVVRYDHGVTRSRPRPEGIRARLRHAKAYAKTQEAQRRLNRLVEDELSAAGLGSASPEAIRLRVYARKLWSLLSRKRGTDKDENKLKPKLEELERWAAEVGLEHLPILATLRDRIYALIDTPETTP
jgi:transcriptional regulator with XRE-family HTH domain